MDLSVIMAVYNQAETVSDAVESILRQSYSDFQLVIIDDYSTDETLWLLKGYARKDKRIKIIVNDRHLGLTRSLNLGLAAAKTKLIARMDADDIALPERLAKQRQYLLKYPEIGLLGTAVELIDSQGKIVGRKKLPPTSNKIRRVILSYCPFVHPTWMFYKAVVRDLGGYDCRFPFAQDYELALRIAAAYPTANLTEPLLKYRVNNDNAISLKRLKTQEKLALYARWLALIDYGYSWLGAWRLVKPLLSFLVPAGIKKIVYAHYYWSGRRYRFSRVVDQPSGY